MSKETEMQEKVATAVQERYLDSFVKAAAAFGIVPSSEDELNDMLKIAARIRDVQEKQAPLVKKAQSSCIKEACQALYALEI